MINVSFEELYNEFRGLVFSVCNRLLKNPSLAEDALQDIFIHLWATREQFREECKLSSWVYRIAYNHCLMSTRKLSSKKEYHTVVDIEKAQLCDKFRSKIAIEDNIEARLLVREIMVGIAPGYGNVLGLHYLYGMEHHEVGACLKIQDGTSKSQLSKGKDAARKLLRKK